ncbi:hypothetical protein GLOTRDRAFT_128842 [Gloeophyllum trabeum ATCC 11539]|uniref:Uncharacterized protein n=1 Tax=Gloeophyllum trabeum (strain ATCC 11539 / FP-39264 / Madison 617) TaxID=670483 RepID=S7Q7W3_GLOTA|nr:uncharacterized protein GLOTRDRAFT_128842 [Gloeophyllum trabeum ATCC 11539]EPQ55622.1 hypothetical protein GLOTRDRAFT_128842 [Gloeophyllum trabeum ATCC 11539]
MTPASPTKGNDIKVARKQVAKEHPGFFPKGSTPPTTPDVEFDEDDFDFNGGFHDFSHGASTSGNRGRDQQPKALGTKSKAATSANLNLMPNAKNSKA